jgi:hypothetical protein
VQRCYERGDVFITGVWGLNAKKGAEASERRIDKVAQDTPCPEIGTQIITFANSILILGNNSSFPIVLEPKK